MKQTIIKNVHSGGFNSAAYSVIVYDISDVD